MLALARIGRRRSDPAAASRHSRRLPEYRGDTVHLDIIDRWGNMIAATPSGGWFQSSPVIPRLGFPLGTRAQMFWLAEGLPSSLIPGARPRTTLSPTLVERDGEPYLVCGSPGGDQQDQWTLLLLVAPFSSSPESAGGDRRADVQQHAFPRFLHPARLRGQARSQSRTDLARGRSDELERRGHRLNVADGWSLGRLCAASSAGGVIKAAATPAAYGGLRDRSVVHAANRSWLKIAAHLGLVRE